MRGYFPGGYRTQFAALIFEAIGAAACWLYRQIRALVRYWTQ